MVKAITRYLFLTIVSVILLMLVACTPTTITNTITSTKSQTVTETQTQKQTQTQTQFIPVPITTTVTVTPSITTATIKTKTYINKDFKYRVNYPEDWALWNIPDPDFPNKVSILQFYPEGGFSPYQNPYATILVKSEQPSINEYIDNNFDLVESHELCLGFVVLDKGTDYYTSLTQWEEALIYHRSIIYPKYNGYYLLSFNCPAELFLTICSFPRNFKSFWIHLLL